MVRMSDKKSEQTFVRFIMPTALIVIGVVLLQFNIGNSIGIYTAQTIGFSVFATGVFSFIIIYNHARNPVATKEVISSIAQALTVYGGLLAALLYQQILTLGSVVTATLVVFMIGMLVSVSVELKCNPTSV